MADSDFTLDTVEAALGLTIRPGRLFPDLEPLPVPAWVVELFDRGTRNAALVSEKARSEFMVVPILLAVAEIFAEDLTIFSGQRLDVEPSLSLVGECDFILALTPAVPRLKAPLVTILAAKQGDIKAGLGQCIAQSVAARSSTNTQEIREAPYLDASRRATTGNSSGWRKWKSSSISRGFT